jgi:hypothetical protein
LLPTACVNRPSDLRESSRIYQPPTLELKAGQPVQTRQGIYVPTKDETWHSDARFRAVEQDALNATAALLQHESRNR